MLQHLGVQVGPGDTEHVTFRGQRVRKRTILVTVGSLSISKKALLLGLALIACQFLDGVLTYLGLKLMGLQMEGNQFLRELMHAYGMAPILFIVKMAAIVLATMLTFTAHSRRWLRPVIFVLVVIYMSLAVVPWTYFIARAHPEEEVVAPQDQTSTEAIRVTVQ